MVLKVINTGSAGNCYLLHNELEALVIECGSSFSLVQRSLDYDISKIQGVLLSHEHLDHSKYHNQFLSKGISIYASKGTHEACDTLKHHRSKVLVPLKATKIGNFKVLPFKIEHDAKEPLGFIINHKETGNVLFLTDSYYSKYRFKNLNNIIIEANYSEDILDNKEDSNTFLRNRILESHLSIENCIELFKANDLSAVNNIVLIHLSDSNSNEVMFKKKVEQSTGKTVTVANSNTIINFDKTPF